MALTDKLTAIADAIRSKTGGTEALTLDGMAEAVENLETGGGGDIDAFINRSITEISNNATKIGSYAFYSCRGLTTANFPLATSIGSSAFSGCSALTTANFPLVTSIGNSAFSNCSALTTANFPLVTSIGNSAFSGCSALTTANFPLVTSIEGSAFSDCNNLTAVIIERTGGVCAMRNTNAFYNCYHILGTVNSTYNPEGLKDGYIYVPDALVEDYKAATNWATYADQIKPLSEYVEVTK